MKKSYTFLKLFTVAAIMLAAHGRVYAQYTNTPESLIFNEQGLFTGCDSIRQSAYSGGSWQTSLIYGFESGSQGYLKQWRWWKPDGTMQAKFDYTRNAENRTVTLVNNYDAGAGIKTLAKTEITYNANGNIVQELIYTTTGNTFTEYERYKYLYDGAGNMTNKTRESYSGGQWIMRSEETFAYNTNNRLTEAVTAIYITASQSWLVTDKIAYTYNGSGNLANREWQKNHDENPAWNYYEKQTFAYNASNKKVYTFKQTWNTFEWVNAELDSVFHLGKILSIDYEWKNNRWMPVSRQECIASSANPPAAPSNLAVTAIKKKDDAKMQLGWTDNSSNESGFIIYRSADGNNWTTVDTAAAGATTFTDTELKYETQYTYRVAAYNMFGISGFSNTVSGTTLVGLQNIFKAVDLKVYPNPAANLLNIAYTANAPQMLQITVSDFSGKQLLRQLMPCNNGENTMQIQLNELSNGVYFITFNGNHIYQVQKIVIQK